MTPKEKAEQLFNKFNSALIDEIKHNAARNFVSFNCALIAVDEIKKSAPLKPLMPLGAYTYWEEVKQEVLKFGKQNG
jgi:hypothetical protein